MPFGFGGLDFLLPEVATVDRHGNVVARQRITGPLAVDLELRDFPFDTQRLPIEVVSYQYDQSEIVFSDNSELVARLDDLSGDGWKYSAINPQTFVYRLKDDGRGGSGIVFAVKAERGVAYYIFTLALPMTLILFLAWMAHWLPVDVIPPRMGTASATVFSLIAFGVNNSVDEMNGACLGCHEDKNSVPPTAGRTMTEADIAAAVEEFERRHIAKVLRLCEGNREQAANLLGISERTLYRKLRQALEPGDQN